MYMSNMGYSWIWLSSGGSAFSSSQEFNFSPQFADAQISLTQTYGSGVQGAYIDHYQYWYSSTPGAYVILTKQVASSSNYFNPPCVSADKMSKVTFVGWVGGGQSVAVLCNLFLWT